MHGAHEERSRAGVVAYLLTVAVLATAVFFGMGFYKSLQNTSDRASGEFVQNLRSGETDKAYQRLDDRLTRGREQYWKDYLAKFTQADGPRLVSHENVDDAFKTYPVDSEPQRYVYAFQLQGKEYRLHMVIYKLDNVWVIAELFGS